MKIECQVTWSFDWLLFEDGDCLKIAFLYYSTRISEIKV